MYWSYQLEIVNFWNQWDAEEQKQNRFTRASFLVFNWHDIFAHYACSSCKFVRTVNYPQSLTLFGIRLFYFTRNHNIEWQLAMYFLLLWVEVIRAASFTLRKLRLFSENRIVRMEYHFQQYFVEFPVLKRMKH